MNACNKVASSLSLPRDVSESFCHFQIGPVAKVKLFFQPQAVGYHIGIVVGTKLLPYIGYGVLLRVFQCKFLFSVELHPTFRSIKRKGKTGIGRRFRLLVFGKILLFGGVVGTTGSGCGSLSICTTGCGTLVAGCKRFLYDFIDDDRTVYRRTILFFLRCYGRRDRRFLLQEQVSGFPYSRKGFPSFPHEPGVLGIDFCPVGSKIFLSLFFIRAVFALAGF